MTMYWNVRARVSRDPRWDWAEVILRCAISIGVAVFCCYLMVQIVNADDTEDKGQPTLNEQLLERAREWNIQTAINQTLQIADRFVCFNDLNDYFEYRLEHDNDTDTDVAFPCPDRDISKLPEDESGK